MENQNNFKFKKLSHFIPSSLSSCHFRTLPDVAESSIPITKSNKTSFNLHENDLSRRTHVLNHSSDAEGRKCPPVTPVSALNPKKKESAFLSFHQSSSSNSGWFTSSGGGDDEETETFFSLSSNSGDSFRLKNSRRFKKCEEMKSIDETGRCSFSSINSYDAVMSKSRRKKDPTAAAITASKDVKKCRKARPVHELGHDQISTELYYCNKNRDSGTRDRCRKTAKNSRKARKQRSESIKGSMIEEGYAVEMNSVDPRSDFRESMVEMIVEKQMFGTGDLQRLLLCFLSLNEISYHRMILDVFYEICQTLFSN